MTEEQFIKKTKDITADEMVSQMQIRAIGIVDEIMTNGRSEANRLNAALKIAERTLRPDQTLKHTGKIEISWMEDTDETDCSHREDTK